MAEIPPMPEGLRVRYEEAAHGMQTGVKVELERRLLSGERTGVDELKHLRVGTNSAMVETSAIVKLLIEKGIITSDEWWSALTDMMVSEKESYEERLGVSLG